MNTVESFQEVKQKFNSGLKKIWGSGGLIGASGSVVLWLSNNADWIMFLWFCVCFISIIISIRLVYRIYKCPVCGQIPTGSSHNAAGNGLNGGIVMNPTSCQKCGAKFE